MRRLLLVPCALILTLPAVGRTDDAADMKALVEKAAKAHGGADNLAKHKAVIIKMKGKFHGLPGAVIDYTSETSAQHPDKLRAAVEGDVMGTTFKVVQIVNGDKGWMDSTFEGARDMKKEEHIEAREAMHAQAVARLAVLADKAYTLSPLGETKVGDKEAVGVLVKHKDRRDVGLFFDKKTHQLLKSESRVKDVQNGGDTELTQETFYEDYKKVGDVLVAHKLTIKRDGKLYVEGGVTDFNPQDKLDDSVFAKP
jgi:hypothetical protein